MKTCQPSLLVLYSGISGFIALLPLYFVVMHMNKSTGSTNSTPTNTIGGTTDRKGDQNQRALWFGVFAQLAIIAIAAAPIPYLIKVRLPLLRTFPPTYEDRREGKKGEEMQVEDKCEHAFVLPRHPLACRSGVAVHFRTMRTL